MSGKVFDAEINSPFCNTFSSFARCYELEEFIRIYLKTRNVEIDRLHGFSDVCRNFGYIFFDAL